MTIALEEGKKVITDNGELAQTINELEIRKESLLQS